MIKFVVTELINYDTYKNTLRICMCLHENGLQFNVSVCLQLYGFNIWISNLDLGFCLIKQGPD